MDKKLPETTNLGVEIMNSKRQVKRKIGHVVQVRAGLPFDLNVILTSPFSTFSFFVVCRLRL